MGVAAGKAREAVGVEGGAAVELWAIPGAGHTAGLRERPADYERRTTMFLDDALGLPTR